MNSPHTLRRSSVSGAISATLAIVLAVVTLGGGALAYEWRQAHAATASHGSGGSHKKKSTTAHKKSATAHGGGHHGGKSKSGEKEPAQN